MSLQSDEMTWMNDLDTLPCYKLYAVALRFNLSETIAERNAFNCACKGHDLRLLFMQGHDLASARRISVGTLRRSSASAVWGRAGSEGDGVIYAIAVVGSCIGEAKTWDLKCVFLFVTPSQKKERSIRWNARVYFIYFCNLATNNDIPNVVRCCR